MRTKLRYFLIITVLCVLSAFIVFASGCNSKKADAQATCKHEMIDDEVIKEATCSTLGAKTVKCMYCGKMETKDIACLPHTEIGLKSIAPTCTQSGLTSGIKCLICEKILVPQKVADPMGHKVATDAMQAPTCTTGGKTEGLHCQHCGLIFVQQESIEALGHNAIIVDALEATCEKDGYTGGSRCERCGETYTGEAIPALGHSYDVGVITKEVTCETNGEKVFTCATCGLTQTESIPALGHSYDDGVITKETTCDRNGLKVYTCAYCINTQEEVLQSFGHSYNEGVVTKAATCDATGLKTLTCANCGITQEELIAALGHTYEGDTCTQCGNTKVTTPTNGEDALQGTWYWDSQITFDAGGTTYGTYDVNFISNGVFYTRLVTRSYNTAVVNNYYYEMLYDTTSAFYDDLGSYVGWKKQEYQAITITDKLADVENGEELLTYLNSYATKVITFTINDTTYYAEEGMTWGEWCYSTYNTAGYFDDGNDRMILSVETSWKYLWDDYATKDVARPDEEIVANKNYEYNGVSGGVHSGGSN